MQFLIFISDLTGLHLGVTGFEPATSWSQTRRSTKLSYTPSMNLLRALLARDDASRITNHDRTHALNFPRAQRWMK
jgi:hypothetical protein